jgi:hypothetical protein
MFSTRPPKRPSLTDIELCTSTGSNAAYCGHVAVVHELALPANSCRSLSPWNIPVSGHH